MKTWPPGGGRFPNYGMFRLLWWVASERKYSQRFFCACLRIEKLMSWLTQLASWHKNLLSSTNNKDCNPRHKNVSIVSRTSSTRTFKDTQETHNKLNNGIHLFLVIYDQVRELFFSTWVYKYHWLNWACFLSTPVHAGHTTVKINHSHLRPRVLAHGRD